MAHRELTADYIDGLQPPSSGEVWISDTIIRGFGVRLWSSGRNGGAAFCIRVVDEGGRSIRRAFRPFSSDSIHFRLKLMRNRDAIFDEDGGIKLSAFLEDAREWAKTEIGRLKGKLPTDAQVRASAVEHMNMRNAAGLRIRSSTLGHLVELVLSNGYSRGWTEAYCDRLRLAFNAFDPEDKVRSLAIAELSEGELVEIIRTSRISPGNFRLLRSLFNVVFWNIHDLGGPAIGQVLPGWRRGLHPEDVAEDFYDQLKDDDYDRLFIAIGSSPFGWRSRICIRICFHLWAPVSRVMNGRWSQIVGDLWYPYQPNERKGWYWRSDRIDAPEFDCLRCAHEKALSENVLSDLWFPSAIDPSKPVSNIGRAWGSVLNEMNWPRVSLSKIAVCYRRRHIIWPNELGRQEIERKLASLKTSNSDQSATS